MKTISGIYKLINRSNGKYYVGSSKNIESRWRSHRYELKHNKHKNVKMQSDWNKGDVFEFVIVEEIKLSDKDKLLQRYINMNALRRVDYYIEKDMILPAILLIAEQHYLDIAKHQVDTNYQRCYQADGGELTYISKQKISKALKGRKFSEEHKQKIAYANTKRIYSEVTRRKIGDFSKQRVHSEMTKRKISLSSKNVDHDKNIYRFTHIKTMEQYIGTRNQFRNKYNYSHSGLRNIIRGKYKTYPVWKVDVIKSI